MPVYDFVCPDHGAFEAMRPMAACAEPCPCPDCGQDAARALLSVPRISRMGPASRHAHETNERSADAPKRLSSHGPGCSCCTGTSRRKTLMRPDGSKSFPRARPWMISH